MSDPSPSGETWVCRAAKGYTRCDILPCTVRGYPEHKRCGPVPSSDTPSDERAVVCAICDDPVAWSCTGDLIHRDRVLRDHDPVLDEATVRWLHGDPDAPAAPSAPVDGPERCHVGIDDGRLVQRLRAETISRAEHLVGPWTVDLIALAADRIEALAGGGGWSPKFETFEQYHAWVAASPTPVDGDSGRRGKAQIMATALHDAGVNTTVSASDNGLLIRVHDRFTPRLLELLALPPVGEERRPVDGAALIAAERQRQIAAEGWTPEHDDRAVVGQLAAAAAMYAVEAVKGACYGQLGYDPPEYQSIAIWPWAVSYWKPSTDPIRNLVRAGALIAAEIDRIQRAAADRGDRA